MNNTTPDSELVDLISIGGFAERSRLCLQALRLMAHKKIRLLLCNRTQELG